MSPLDAPTPDKHDDARTGRREWIGREVSRVDGPLKVAGAARFAAEVRLDGLLYAAIVPSTIARGRITQINTAEAEGLEGVVEVMTYQNAPRMHPPPRHREDKDGAAFSALPVMQDSSVHWNGEAVAVVIANTHETAEHAASLIRVSYDLEPARLSFRELAGKAKLPKDVLGQPAQVRVGDDAETALHNAEVVIDQTYTTPRYNHNAIEPHAVTAIWDSDNRLTLHDSTQMIAATTHSLARVFGLAPENVRVLSPFVGGGFGGKCLWSHTLLCAAAAKLANRPVLLALSREHVFRLIGGRAVSEQRVALGSRRDGTLAALIHTGRTGVVRDSIFPEQFTFPARHLYAADRLFLEQKIVELDIVANTAMRAPGESIGTFALESALVELAVELDLDPIELRRRIEPARDPTTHRQFSSRNLMEAYRRGAERFGWSQRNRRPGMRRSGEWRIGHGVASAYYPYIRVPGASARIRITADGRAIVQAGAQEMGMGTATAQAQHAAERLGLPLDRVTFEYGDSRLPRSSLAGGSSQTVSIAAAVTAACKSLIAGLLKLAPSDSPLFRADPNDIDMRDGGLFRTDGNRDGESYTALLKRAGRADVEAYAEAPPPEESKEYSMHSYGAQFCEVRVNEITGEIRVSRWLGSFDAGRILNPKTAASQFRGGIVMGIGMALMEETLFDERSGRIMNPSMAEYHVPTHMDVPPIEVMWTDIPDPQSPAGLRGIGEIGITGCAAAIANAVYNATGKRLRSLPLTPDKVLSG